MRKIVLVAATLALLAGACSKTPAPNAPNGQAGGNPVTLSGAVNAHGTKDVSGSGTTVTMEIEADDFYFEPTFVKAAPGAKVTVEVENEGSATHTFTIDSPSVDKSVSPDQKTTVTFTLPASGVVAFYCKFHRAQGMQGAFYFTAGDSAPSGGGGTPAGSYGY
jgi:plastocyanin